MGRTRPEMSDFIIDITTPPESAMAVDITVSENPLAIETIGMASSFSVDVLPTEPMVRLVKIRMHPLKI